jgi:long-subunit acyl-CoA synthetase (AMP-forming)
MAYAEHRRAHSCSLSPGATSPILALNRLRKFRDDAAGVPLPNVEIKIVAPDAEGRGEIVAYAQRSFVEVTPELIDTMLDKEIRALNRKLPNYKQIRRVEVRETEFAKTTTQKIKRHLVHHATPPA